MTALVIVLCCIAALVVAMFGSLLLAMLWPPFGDWLFRPGTSQDTGPGTVVHRCCCRRCG